MSTYTDIQWCDPTVNPVMGCSGCELWTEGRKTCYAGHLHKRRKGHPGFAPDFSSPTLYPGRMQQAARLGDLTGHRRPEKPWLDGLPRLIFVSDMGDALSEHGARRRRLRIGSASPFAAPTGSGRRGRSARSRY